MGRHDVNDARRRSRIAMAIGAVATLVLAVAPAPASAGVYTVYSCRTPLGGGAGMSGWNISDGPNPAIDAWFSRCPGGPFTMRMDPAQKHPANDIMRAVFNAPPNTSISAYSVSRSAQLADPYAYYLDQGTAAGWVQQQHCFPWQGCSAVGDTNAPLGAHSTVQASGLTDVTGLRFTLTCAWADNSTAQCPATAPAAQFNLYRSAITLEDNTDPAILATSGPLVSSSGQSLSGSVPVDISATDAASGVYQALFEVDNRIVQAQTLDGNNGLCQPPFTVPVPCKQAVSGTASLDTTRLADGAHTVTILVTNATGVAGQTAAYGPITIHTANAACNPLPAAGSLRMRVGIVRARRRPGAAVRAGSGRRLLVRGRLLDAAGSPVKFAGVCVAERSTAGRFWLPPGGSLETDAHGRFLFPVGAGPSRRVYFVTRVPGGAVSSSVMVNVAAPVSVGGSSRVLANGQTLTLRGRALRGPIPSGGLLVELQAWRGAWWQTFGTAQTDRSGRFSFNYTFTRTFSPQRYELRARVPEQPTYPYATGASRPLYVVVSG